MSLAVYLQRCSFTQRSCHLSSVAHLALSLASASTGSPFLSQTSRLSLAWRSIGSPPQPLGRPAQLSSGTRWLS
uniref:Uncharacterized protein n=1 Tax=Panstrongylus lignarius TaxID=156445 RepID=A0A224XTS6_9HEMI